MAIRFVTSIDQRFPASLEDESEQSLEAIFAMPIYLAALLSMVVAGWSQFNMGFDVADRLALLIWSKTTGLVVLGAVMVLRTASRGWLGGSEPDPGTYEPDEFMLDPRGACVIYHCEGAAYIIAKRPHPRNPSCCVGYRYCRWMQLSSTHYKRAHLAMKAGRSIFQNYTVDIGTRLHSRIFFFFLMVDRPSPIWMRWYAGLNESPI